MVIGQIYKTNESFFYIVANVNDFNNLFILNVYTIWGGVLANASKVLQFKDHFRSYWNTGNTVSKLLGNFRTLHGLDKDNILTS